MQNRNSSSEKDILYSMLRREISNLLSGVPIFAAFEGTISSFIIQLVDPYVSAFITDDNKIDTEQLSAFVSEEALNKINNFKDKYRKETEKNENKINF